jgi:Undecaprenyl-phosphate glucose phosphotransferase
MIHRLHRIPEFEHSGVSRERRRLHAAASQDRSLFTSQQTGAILRGGFSFIAGLSDVFAVLASSILAGVAYHLFAYGASGAIEGYAKSGLSVALLLLIVNVGRNEYSLFKYLQLSGHGRSLLFVWNIAFVGALALAFATKTTGDFSRGSVALFYLGGMVSLLVERALVVQFVQSRAKAGDIAARRIFLVGVEGNLESFAARHRGPETGVQIVSAAVLRGMDTLEDDLALAAASARMLRPDDVYILAPWSEAAMIDACVETFLRVPAAIHLGPERVLDRFIDASISQQGGMASLNIVRRPLTSSEVAFKRLFDIAGALCGLIMLASLFAVVAVAIKLESRGPVFFRQRRYGFNQEPFRIWKFRSMRSMDDGRVVVQAQVNDPRITRVGRVLRRYNIDELPQLINVLVGDMSLVGPRPHAMAHDQKFEQNIAYYARRHNVKPGITGWAQVNGYRGETDTEDKMRARVEHDLFYIDNWSLLLDLKILWLTVFSSKAYKNAV